MWICRDTMGKIKLHAHGKILPVLTVIRLVKNTYEENYYLLRLDVVFFQHNVKYNLKVSVYFFLLLLLQKPEMKWFLNFFIQMFRKQYTYLWSRWGDTKISVNGCFNRPLRNPEKSQIAALHFQIPHASRTRVRARSAGKYRLIACACKTISYENWIDCHVNLSIPYLEIILCRKNIPSSEGLPLLPTTWDYKKITVAR